MVMDTVSRLWSEDGTQPCVARLSVGQGAEGMGARLSSLWMDGFGKYSNAFHYWVEGIMCG